ncbi:MAG: pantetheine-phosphate adenylyltransferase [Burkholderiales bacterium]
MISVVYPGSFDPITRGHEDLVRRASELFDEVVVAVAQYSGKTAQFSFAERVAMAEEVLANYGNVRVVGFSGLLMDFMRDSGIRVLLRGLRAVSDFEYEIALAGMNRTLYPEAETLFLTPSEQYMFISARQVREIAQLGGDVSAFVHPLIKARLTKKYGQTRARTKRGNAVRR